MYPVIPELAGAADNLAADVDEQAAYLGLGRFDAEADLDLPLAFRRRSR